MDPYKLLRERNAISLFSSFEWKRALDFGCGVGRYFSVFEEITRQGKNDRHLTAIDDDIDRVELARANANAVMERERKLKFDVVHGSENSPAVRLQREEYDLILCSQVLGHVPTQSCAHIAQILGNCLSPKGVAVFLVPFTSETRIREIYGARYQPGQEFFFEANLDQTGNIRSHRKPITAEMFDKQITNPEQGKLPVRSFSVSDLRITSLSNCPAPIEDIPSFVQAIKGSDRKVLAMAYTVHEFHKRDGYASFGDMIIRISN